MTNGSAERFDRIERALDRLASLSVETAERQSITEHALAQLSGRQSETEQSLAKLTQRVDSFITSTHEWQEAMTAGQKQLLTAQVLLTEEQRKLAEQERRTDERLNALIQVVDGIVRRRPSDPPS